MLPMKIQGWNMNYLLLEHTCYTCRYVTDAFSLLRLPLKTIPIEELSEKNISDAHAIIACENMEDNHSNQLINLVTDSNISLILFSDKRKHKQHTNLPIHFLKTNFSNYELNDALAQCLSKKNNIPVFTHCKYPVFEKLVGTSQHITKIKTLIKQVALSDSTALILGESGTGKDVIASCIHYLSERRDNPIVPINCGAIPSELMESELFGHEKGAFTGAMTKRVGRFEIANKGTLFLDEIGDMPMQMQVKLLRVIQDKKIIRVGGNDSIDVDVRLIAATNKFLEELIQQNKFREDLYYRLNVVPIDVPSLRDRPEDIPALIDYHLEKIYARTNHRVVFTEKAMDSILSYPWPGNVRELQNFLERMIILHPDQSLDENDINIHQPKKSRSLSSQHHYQADKSELDTLTEPVF